MASAPMAVAKPEPTLQPGDEAPGAPAKPVPRSGAEDTPRTVAVIKPEAAAQPDTRGLLVRASPAIAWPALLQSLDDLEITREHEDDRQHLLTTGWIDADYDDKNQLLVMRSKEGPEWAFNIFGKGIERHRFQLIMVPANEGERTIIYAYHTASQEQVDKTPDSSQTVLDWEDRKTDPDVAVALLRRLRILIPQ